MAFQPDNNSLYKISTALDRKMVLDACQDEGQLNQLILYDYCNGPNQKFGKYAFFCSLNNGTIEVPQGSTKQGQNIVVSKPNKALNQFWELKPVNQNQYGPNAYYIQSFCGQALDVYYGKAKNKQKVIQWKFTGSKNQVWIIEKV